RGRPRRAPLRLPAGTATRFALLGPSAGSKSAASAASISRNSPFPPRPSLPPWLSPPRARHSRDSSERKLRPLPFLPPTQLAFLPTRRRLRACPSIPRRCVPLFCDPLRECVSAAPHRRRESPAHV